MAVTVAFAGVTTQIIVLCISCLLYVNTLQAGFTFDDNFAVVTNGDVADPSKPLWLLFKDDFWGQEIKSEQSHKSYRPLTVLSFRILRISGPILFSGRAQRKLASEHDNTRGLDPLPFHAANIVLNAAVTLLVYRLALQLCHCRDQTGHRHVSPATVHSVIPFSNLPAPTSPHRRQPATHSAERARQSVPAAASPRAEESRGSPRQMTWAHWAEASLAALLFVVHPIHTEAVAGIVGQAELLCAALSILGLMSYIAATNQPQWHWGWIILAVVLVWAASLAKEIGVTTVGAMVLFDALLVPFDKPPAGEGGGALAHLRALLQSRKTARVAIMGASVLLYVRLRAWIAVSHLVSIYRKVENPIPFAESQLTRIMSTGYLHARYAGLLFAPVQLSADWSFACIPLVEQIADARNAATLALYAALVWVVAAAAPWRMVLEVIGLGIPVSSTAGVSDERPAGQRGSVRLRNLQSGVAKEEGHGGFGGGEGTASATKSRLSSKALLLRQARWRLVVVYGLLVGPFFPASNVLFYVGTFIGERLLYFPSIGYCLLAADIILRLVVSDNGHVREQEKKLAGNDGGFCEKARKRSAEGDAGPGPVREQQKISPQAARGWQRKFLATALVATFLLALGVRTHRRNWDWENEEILFRAAQKVCWDSAKVQLNSGILERRYQNWDRALMHFEHARAVEPGYCEPDYWIGVTLLAQQKNTSGALLELERAIHCKYVAVDAVTALAQVYQQLMQLHPKDHQIHQRWAGILINAPLNRPEDGCDVLEGAANAADIIGIMQPCVDALSDFAEGTPQAGMLSCIRSRQTLRRVLMKHNPKSVAAKQAAYSYIGSKGEACRSRPSVKGLASSTGHMGVVHLVQQADAEDPWLQHEWAEVLVAASRASEAVLHFEAAGVMLHSWLAAGQPGDVRLGIDPFTGKAERLRRALVAFAALKSVERIQQVGSDKCRSLIALANARQRMADVIAHEAPDEVFGGTLGAASIAESAQQAVDTLRRQSECFTKVR